MNNESNVTYQLNDLTTSDCRFFFKVLKATILHLYAILKKRNFTTKSNDWVFHLTTNMFSQLINQSINQSRAVNTYYWERWRQHCRFPVCRWRNWWSYRRSDQRRAVDCMICAADWQTSGRLSAGPISAVCAPSGRR